MNCKHCRGAIHEATEAEMAGLHDKRPRWRHDSGYWCCLDVGGHDAEVEEEHAGEE